MVSFEQNFALNYIPFSSWSCNIQSCVERLTSGGVFAHKFTENKQLSAWIAIQRVKLSVANFELDFACG